MKNKKWTIGILLLMLAAVSLCAALFLTGGKSYDIRITIPAGSTEAFLYSEEEICPKGKTVTLYAGEGMGDGEVILQSVEAKGEGAYKPTYITPGMPVKMEVERGAWYKIGVGNMQNASGEDIVVYITASDVEVRIGLKAMTTEVGDDYAAIAWEDKIYVPYGALAAYGDRGNQIGIVDGDKNHRVYECKGYSADEWIAAAFSHDAAMLYREIDVTDIPAGWQSEYGWNP
ncbi:MAG: hypothetical protein NC432_05980 [Roseburia sp.]|nr:hypothetical protein [Roseburia sp.]MCM1098854.1 hypothetical protein [Ruminococcus flavefaciens]